MSHLVPLLEFNQARNAIWNASSATNTGATTQRSPGIGGVS